MTKDGDILGYARVSERTKDGIETAAAHDQIHDLLEQDKAAQLETERAADEIRARFGKDAIIRGRSLN